MGSVDETPLTLQPDQPGVQPGLRQTFCRPSDVNPPLLVNTHHVMLNEHEGATSCSAAPCGQDVFMHIQMCT